MNSFKLTPFWNCTLLRAMTNSLKNQLHILLLYTVYQCLAIVVIRKTYDVAFELNGLVESRNRFDHRTTVSVTRGSLFPLAVGKTLNIQRNHPSRAGGVTGNASTITVLDKYAATHYLPDLPGNIYVLEEYIAISNQKIELLYSDFLNWAIYLKGGNDYFDIVSRVVGFTIDGKQYGHSFKEATKPIKDGLKEKNRKRMWSYLEQFGIGLSVAMQTYTDAMNSARSGASPYDAGSGAAGGDEQLRDGYMDPPEADSTGGGSPLPRCLPGELSCSADDAACLALPRC